MHQTTEQSLLLDIVLTWKISEIPEYRGFRCANCQQYKNEAWYHWVGTGEYKLPIHLCNDTCENAFREKTIHIDQKKKQVVDRASFGKIYTFSPVATSKFREIVSSWPEDKNPELKAFTCDLCEKDLEIDTDGVRKGYHVWWKMDDRRTLAELHFHRTCADSLGINE